MRVMIQLANFSCSGRRVFTCLLEQADLTHRSTTYWFTALYINSTICDCSGNLNKTLSLRQAGLDYMLDGRAETNHSCID